MSRSSPPFERRPCPWSHYRTRRACHPARRSLLCKGRTAKHRKLVIWKVSMQTYAKLSSRYTAMPPINQCCRTICKVSVTCKIVSVPDLSGVSLQVALLVYMNWLFMGLPVERVMHAADCFLLCLRLTWLPLVPGPALAIDRMPALRNRY